MKCKIQDLELDSNSYSEFTQSGKELDLRVELETAVQSYKNNYGCDLVCDIEVDEDTGVYFEKDFFSSVLSDLIDCIMVSSKNTTDGKKWIMIQSQFKRSYSGQGVIHLSIKNYLDIDKFGNKVDDLPSTFIHIEETAHSLGPNCFKGINSQSALRVFRNEKATRAKKIIQNQGGKLWLRDNFFFGRGGGLSFEFTMLAVDD